MKFLLVISFFYSCIMSSYASRIILGDDSRTQVHNISTTQSKRVGRLIMKEDNSKKKYACSATVIADQYIITAAHCVFSTAHSKIYDSIEFFPQYRGNRKSRPKRLFVDKAWVPYEYLAEAKKLANNAYATTRSISTNMIMHDVAVLRLKSYQDPVRASLGAGAYSLGSMYDKIKGSDDIFEMSLYSYPNDKKGGTLWKEECLFRHDYVTIGLTSCDIFAGASGSGVIATNAYSSDKLVGVVSAETDEDNKITFLAQFVVDEINKIMNLGSSDSYFKSIGIGTEPYHYIGVENNCHKKVDVAIRIKNSNNEWKTYQFYGVEQGETAQAPASDNSIFYYYAKSYNSTWRGRSSNEKDITREVFGKYDYMRRRKVSGWGDHFLKITCNN